MNARLEEESGRLGDHSPRIIKLDTNQKSISRSLEYVKSELKESTDDVKELRTYIHKLELEMVSLKETMKSFNESLSNFYNQTFKPLSETVEKLRSQQLKLIGASIILIPLISWGLERLAEKPLIENPRPHSQKIDLDKSIKHK